MTTLPMWAVLAVAVGSPLAAFVATLLGQRILRRRAEQDDEAAKREEMMRMVRWAGELAVSADPARSRLGVQTLLSLRRTPWLLPEDREVVRATLLTVTSDDGGVP